MDEPVFFFLKRERFLSYFFFFRACFTKKNEVKNKEVIIDLVQSINFYFLSNFLLIRPRTSSLN